MLSTRKILFGWQGTALVAVTYVHFLIFAQFAFLGRLSAWHLNSLALKSIMAAMAVGGIFFSLLVPRLESRMGPRNLIHSGLLFCAVGAFLSRLQLSFVFAMLLGFLIGAGTALLTVTLATHVREWTGEYGSLLRVGIGVGIGYWICNIPALFNASSAMQALVSGLLCLLALAIPLPGSDSDIRTTQAEHPSISLPRTTFIFAILIWLDSAAFYIIQHNGTLKSATWQGDQHLLAIGVLHFIAAIAAGWILHRNGARPLLCAAYAFLAVACLLLQHDVLRAAATYVYPIGVSLYSVALVAWPSLLSGATNIQERSRIAARIYAVAGWIGSALGIGMAEHLGIIPYAFLLFSGAVVLFPLLIKLIRIRLREAVAVTAILAVAAILNHHFGSRAQASPEDAIARGRQVYISEGCINCHSQYIRPNSPDIFLWGPAQSVAYVHSQRPPLIGNRRQGPDLSAVGSRRSAFWLRMHFIDPPAVSGASIMPSFAMLFHDQRGDDLVAYLSSLRASDENLSASRNAWKPVSEARIHADAERGAALYKRFCSTCHDVDGKTRVAWQRDFHPLPPDLLRTPFTRMAAGDSTQPVNIQLARIIKFGIPGTNMPGHETLEDADIASLAEWIAQQRAQSSLHTSGR